MNPILLKTSIITNYNTSIPTQIAKILRRADKFTRLCVIASYLTTQNCNSIISRYTFPEERSIIISTRFGPIETNFRYLDTIFDFGESQGSPTLFSHSVHNTAAGYISRIFDFKGPIYTINSYSYPLLKALLTASIILQQNLTKLVLILETEVKSNLLNEGINNVIKAKDFSVFSYSIAWLLTNQFDLINDINLVFDNISIKDFNNHKLLYNLFEPVTLQYQNRTQYINSYQLGIKLTEHIENSLYKNDKDIFFKINSKVGIVKANIYTYKK